MDLIINIPEHIYRDIKLNPYKFIIDYSERIADEIVNGTPLPKGHGNLIQQEDAEAIFKNARIALLEQSRKETIKDLNTRDLMLLNAQQFIHLIQPIIKADKEQDNDSK